MARSHVITSICCARDHTLALLASGKVFGWCRDGSGRIGPGTAEYCSTSKAPTGAVEVVSPQRLVSIAAGYGVSLAVTADKQVAIWGASSAGIGGRLGAIALAIPNRLDGIDDACTVVAGEFMFGAIDAAEMIHTWGLNVEGALGRPTPQINALPGPVTAVPKAAQLALGKGYLLALTRAGEPYAWGDNAAGQLVLGHLRSVATPEPSRLKANGRSIAAGAASSAASANPAMPSEFIPFQSSRALKQTVALGSVEEWTVFNMNNIPHPCHIHVNPLLGGQNQRQSDRTRLGRHHSPAQARLADCADFGHLPVALCRLHGRIRSALPHTGPRRHGHDAIGRGCLRIALAEHSYVTAGLNTRASRQ